MHINFRKTRHHAVFVIIVSLFAVLFARLLYIQIIRHTHLSDLAAKQHKIFVKLEPRRGKIYDRLNRVLAIYLDTSSIYVVPNEISDKEHAARILAEELGTDQEKLSARLARDNYFAWVKRKVSTATAERVKNLKIKGVYLITEPKRFYPGGKLACHVLGITNIDNVGIEGIELYYDNELKGEYGWRRSARDAKKRELISFETDTLPARDGNSLVLTIDEVIQHILETEIERLIKAYKPKAVSIAALNPRTGEILGLANYPWFDLNDISSASVDSMRNRAIADSFEPGSIFKVVTASAALNEGIVNFDTKFFCENGAYKIGKRTLHDYRPYGTLTFRQVIEKSSNIGTTKVAAKLGKEKLSAYIKRFNFSSPTGVDLPGEVSGIMRDSSSWSYVDMTTIPMGQGIAVTALQLAACISAIANEGVLMRPYIVKKHFNEEGALVRENKPKALRSVISKEAATQVKELLLGVIERGTGKRASLDNFKACGKTGTAQKVNPRGGYYKNRYIASFIGFAPYDKPTVSLVVCVDEPRGKYFGGQVGAPAFKNIMEKILAYAEVESPRDAT
ncbi:MAG: penicillin-binding protein [Candidatus Omnitrophica bacterium]|nr:penicillin-binding protein [Candidatus Omnitrophota bacterium]